MSIGVSCHRGMQPFDHVFGPLKELALNPADYSLRGIRNATNNLFAGPVCRTESHIHDAGSAR